MSKKVLVFKDIKNKRWTLWNLNRTIHLGYKNTLKLKNCIFVVDQTKRKKVLKTGSRFPHAWVIGDLDLSKAKKNLINEVSYNPFKDRYFKKNKKTKLLKSSKSFLDSTGKVWV